MRLLTVMAVALGVAGCGLVGEPSRPDLFFSYAPIEEAAEPVARRQRGGIEFIGTIRTPCLPYMARGSITVSRSVIELRVSGRAQAACVDQEPGNLEYFAAVSARPGTYRVRVIHEWPGLDWPTEVALDTQMTLGGAN
jgi:hypothetical protein